MMTFDGFGKFSGEILSRLVTEQALNAFWNTVAESCPDATSGDLEPLIEFDLNEAAGVAVRAWVRNNVPSAPPVRYAVEVVSDPEDDWSEIMDQRFDTYDEAHDFARLTTQMTGHKAIVLVETYEADLDEWHVDAL